MPSKKSSERPRSRTLVRWDENLNELLLLTIQSVCNKQSVKIPWGEVAETMGHNATEGAIVQHLAKLRQRRVDCDKAVPPPLKRFGAGTKKKSSGGAQDKSASRTKRKRDYVSDSEEDSDPAPILTYNEPSSGDEYSPKKKMTKAFRRKPGAVNIKRDEVINGRGSDGDISDETSSDLLVPNADFLSLPNDESAFCSNPEPQKTLVVTLRYRKRPEKGEEMTPVKQEYELGETFPLPSEHVPNDGVFRAHNDTTFPDIGRASYMDGFDEGMNGTDGVLSSPGNIYSGQYAFEPFPGQVPFQASTPQDDQAFFETLASSLSSYWSLPDTTMQDAYRG